MKTRKRNPPTPAQLAKRLEKLEAQADRNAAILKDWMREVDRFIVVVGKRFAAENKARKDVNRG